MNDLRQQPALQAAGAPGAEPAPDPLHNLYRMSRTAGLGSGEYVAINNTSVVAFLMGLASVLALLNPFLLLFVVGALILGVMALLQIRSSNGTQTGQGFAVAGILLALVFGGTTGGRMALAHAERRQSETEIANVIGQLGDRIANRQYAQAYATLFSEKFKKDYPENVFTTRWEGIERSAGPVTSIRWGGRVQFEPARGVAGRRAHTKAVFKFEKYPEESPLAVLVVEQDGEWFIEQIGDIFNREQERQQEQQRTPSGSPVGPQLTPAQ